MYLTTQLVSKAIANCPIICVNMGVDTEDEHCQCEPPLKSNRLLAFCTFRRILSITQYYHTCNYLIDFYGWCLSSVLNCVTSTRNKWSCLTSWTLCLALFLHFVEAQWLLCFFLFTFHSVLSHLVVSIHSWYIFRLTMVISLILHNWLSFDQIASFTCKRF